MQLERHTPGAFADAIQALMPPGVVWEWGGGFVDDEARQARLAKVAHLVDADAVVVLDAAPANDTPGFGAVLMTGPAQELARIDAEVNPLLDAAVGQHRPKALSWRLVDYSAIAQAVDPGASLKTVRPFCAGSSAGGLLWSGRARYLILVGHALADGADLSAIEQALNDFKQAHMLLFFIRRDGDLGWVFYAQD